MKTIDLTENYSELNGLRGLAILLVFLFHCMPSMHVLGPYIWPLKASCWIGVDLFFVLSGFLITRILIGTRDSTHKYAVFYGKRILRIVPLYIFVLLMVFSVLSYNPVVEKALEGTAPSLWYYTYTYNIYVTLNNGWASSDFLNHFWSLCIEEQFYLFWPWIIFVTPLKRLPAAMAAVIVVS